MNLLQSKIFVNCSTTLPKLVLEALVVKADDSVRYILSKDGVQVSKMPLDDTDLKVHAHASTPFEALAAAEDLMHENRKLLRELK